MPAIIICCNSFPPEKGGAPNRIYNMAMLLRDNGYEVTVITAMPNYPTGAIFPGYRGRLIHKEILDGIWVLRIWMIPSNSGNLLVRGCSLLSHLLSFLILAAPRLLFKKASAVIISSPPLINAWLAAWLSRLGRKKIIVNISDIWPLTATEMGALKDGFIFRLLQQTERHLYRWAKAFAGQSEEILEHIRQTVPHGKPAFLYRNLQPAQQPGGQATERENRIIYAGNLGHAQGMLELVQKTDFKGAGIKLDIFGAGAEYEELAAFVAANPQLGVYLYPTLTPDKLNERLPAYRAVLIPLKTAIRGAVPSKLFMAAANGLPVLFCGGGEGTKLVEKHRLGWTSQPGDVQALQQNLRTLAALSQEDWQQQQAAVRAANKTFFSKDSQDHDFIRFLKDALAK